MGCFPDGTAVPGMAGRETGSIVVRCLWTLVVLTMFLPAVGVALAQPLEPGPASGSEPEGEAPFMEVIKDPVTGQVHIQGRLGGNGTEPSRFSDQDFGRYPGQYRDPSRDQYPTQGGNPFGGFDGSYKNGLAP